MSILVMSQVFSRKLGNPTLKAVLVKLADYANDAGGNIFPAVNTVAEQVEVSGRTVQRSIQALLTMEVLEIEQQGGRFPGDTTRYRINLTKLLSLPLSAQPMGDSVSPVSMGDNAAMGDTDDIYGRHTVTQSINRTIKRKEEEEAPPVRIVNGRIVLSPTEYEDQLARFGGNAEDLRDALDQAAAYVQPRGPHLPEVQVRSQLARISRMHRASTAGRGQPRRQSSVGKSGMTTAELLEGARKLYEKGLSQ